MRHGPRRPWRRSGTGPAAGDRCPVCDRPRLMPADYGAGSDPGGRVGGGGGGGGGGARFDRAHQGFMEHQKAVWRLIS